ncbi:1000_t:CDS:2, partial [Entrophospora sp. SA101]
IADLEISIKSLMKINSELDATNKKQAIEIQDLARRLQMYVNSEENRKESDIRFRKICLVIDTLIRDGKNALEYKSKIGGSREIGINGTDDIAVAVFNNKVFIGGSILPSAPSDPYFDDVIDKYFCRPKNHIFESMTYPDYFRDYNIKNKPPGPRSKLYSTRDLKGSELATWGVFKFQGEVPEHVSNEIPASFDQTGSQFTDK